MPGHKRPQIENACGHQAMVNKIMPANNCWFINLLVSYGWPVFFWQAFSFISFCIISLAICVLFSVINCLCSLVFRVLISIISLFYKAFLSSFSFLFIIVIHSCYLWLLCFGAVLHGRVHICCVLLLWCYLAVSVLWDYYLLLY